MINGYNKKQLFFFSFPFDVSIFFISLAKINIEQDISKMTSTHCLFVFEHDRMLEKIVIDGRVIYMYRHHHRY